MTKAQIRSIFKEKRNKLTENELSQYSQGILERLLQTELYCNSTRIFTFVSFRSEVDTHEIIRTSLRSGKKVYVPRVEPQGMEFYEISSLEGLVQSKYGILEPIAEEAGRYTTACDTAEDKPIEYSSRNISEYKNLMLLPGLAFDLQGNRIGYGAGYYDRYLSGHESSNFCKLALAYDFQIMEHLPADDFDRKVDYVLTPSRIIECSNHN